LDRSERPSFLAVDPFARHTSEADGDVRQVLAFPGRTNLPRLLLVVARDVLGQRLTLLVAAHLRQQAVGACQHDLARRVDADRDIAAVEDLRQNTERGGMNGDSRRGARPWQIVVWHQHIVTTVVHACRTFSGIRRIAHG
jgi:hypothetical protein